MIPGLPDRRYYGQLSLLKPQQKYTLLRQLHNAQRAGRHIDFRIGSPQLGMFSWAAPKDLPQQPGQRRLMITQPLHTYAYKDFTGQIYSPYGRGTVQKLQQSPIIILQNTGDKIKFTRADKRNAPVYTMIKTRNGNWITSVKIAEAPPVIAEYQKQHFKSVSLQEAADMLDRGAVAYAKSDGTGALAEIRKNGIQVYGIRRDKNGKLIRYTDHIGGLRDLNIPPQMVGKVFRVQVTGQQDGKPVAANTLSGLLNSSLQRNIQTRRDKNIKLHLIALALAGKQDDYTQRNFRDMVAKLNTDKIRTLPEITTKQDFSQQLRAMQNGSHPITQQGFVLHAPGKRPVKAKLFKDTDVVIRNVFPSTAQDRAGGFQYSLPQSQQIVGRVGTGFSHQQLQDMLNNPQNYIGRTARINYTEQYPSGAYRAPSFISMRTEGD